jgi:uncharacterized protein YhfF
MDDVNDRMADEEEMEVDVPPAPLIGHIVILADNAGEPLLAFIEVIGINLLIFNY